MHMHITKPKGILNEKTSAEKFCLTRYAPAPDLRFFVRHYWVIHWDLRGQEPYVSEVLSHPNVNMVLEPGQSCLAGVTTGKFARRLEGKGGVFGVKFHAGAFYPFLRRPISELRNCLLPLREIFGADADRLEAAVFAYRDSDTSPDENARIALVEDFLRVRLPEPDENVIAINQIVDCIMTDRTITKVDDLVSRVHWSKRTLQRLFYDYVGVSPKWVIQRYRLHDAAEALTDEPAPDWAKLALELGYFDQAHFIKDFRTTVGKTPTEYARMLTVN